MIVFEEYKKLSQDEQAELMWMNGKHLLVKQISYCIISLYALSDFYIELWYSPGENKILDLIPFKDQERLDHLLDRIDLEKLLNL